MSDYVSEEGEEDIDNTSIYDEKMSGKLFSLQYIFGIANYFTYEKTMITFFPSSKRSANIS